MREFTASIARICAACLLWVALSLQPSYAQDETDIVASAPAAAQEAAKVATQAAHVQTPAAFDLNDAALKEALDARAAADQAIIEALQAQRSAVQEESLASDKPAAKKSLIPTTPEDIKALGLKIWETAKGWLTSPSFLAQIGAVFLIWWILAPLIARQLRNKLFFLRDAPSEGSKLFLVRKYVYEARALTRPIINIAALALAAVIIKSAFGQDWLVRLAQGLAVVFLLYTAIKQFAPNDLTKNLGTWIAIPLALLVVFGYFDNLLVALDAMALGSGENPISALTLIKLAIFGSAFFWLGNFSNKKGQTAIRSQENLDSGIREIVAKFLQIAIFGAAAIMAMSAAGIGLGGLVVIFSALSLGIGLGLQPIAANFVSGLIILFDRSVRIGDFVSLPDGQEGFVEAINMRSTTVETTDGKDVMVPNTTFTESLYENWTHKDPRQRYEVHFSVAYDTDIDKLEEIIVPVFEKHPLVLDAPEEPDLELREFGENGIMFAVEFWCSGIDDGPNKFTSDLNFEVWRVLKKHGIKMPLPQREVRTLK